MIDEFRNKILQGNVMEQLKRLPDNSVDMMITSPPYWGLRDYETESQIWDECPHSCTHVWGEDEPALRSRWGDTDTLSDKQASNRGSKQNVAAMEKSTGNFCMVTHHHEWIEDGGQNTKLSKGGITHDIHKTINRGPASDTYRCGVEACPAWKGSLGLEPTPDLYIKHLVNIMFEVKRVLKSTGTIWINLGDTYAGSSSRASKGGRAGFGTDREGVFNLNGARQKSIIGVPDRLKIALIDAGFICRNEIVWHKPNAMPSSASDRFTNDTEKIYFFTTQPRYYFEQQFEDFTDASVEDLLRRKTMTYYSEEGSESKYASGETGLDGDKTGRTRDQFYGDLEKGRNMRTTWKPYAVQEREIDTVDYRNLPPHDEVRKYLQFHKKKREQTIEEIEAYFETQAPHHWFEKNGSFPSREDWIKLMKWWVVKPSDFSELHIQMTTTLTKPSEKTSSVRGRNKRTTWKYNNSVVEATYRQGMHHLRGTGLVTKRPKDQFPTQKEFVDWMREHAPKKKIRDYWEDTGLGADFISETTMDHWYRYDSSGFAFPSFSDWVELQLEFFRIELGDWQDKDGKIMKDTASIENPDNPEDPFPILSEFFFETDAIGKYEGTGYGGDGTSFRGHSGYMKADGSLMINPKGRNMRTTWEEPEYPVAPSHLVEVQTRAFAEAHFAIFPEELIETPIIAGSPTEVCTTCNKPKIIKYEEERVPTRPGKDILKGKSGTDANPNKALHSSDLSKYREQIVRKNFTYVAQCKHKKFKPGIVMDIFMGSGTTAVVAKDLGRDYIGIELNPDYIKIADKRIRQGRAKIDVPQGYEQVDVAKGL